LEKLAARHLQCTSPQTVLALQDGGSKHLPNVGNYLPNDDVTFQKIWTFINIAVRTSNLKQRYSYETASVVKSYNANIIIMNNSWVGTMQSGSCSSKKGEDKVALHAMKAWGGGGGGGPF
jgi:hypothetical protein